VTAFDLRVEEDGLAVLTFDLPGEKVNKFSTAVIAELGDVLVRLTREARIRALLVRSGKPDIFIAGADVKEFASVRPEDVRTGVERLQSLFEQLANLPYPTVAAINGVCLGGGTELALACDYRLMSDARKAQIGLPEVRLGIFPAWGGCTRLPRVVGLAAALDLILTGKSLDARRAKKIGLVDEAVPAAIFDEWSKQFARSKRGTARPRSRRKPMSLADHALEGTPMGRRVIFSKAREGVMKQTGGHYPAPLEALEVIEESYGRPVADGLAIEARHIGLIFGGEVQRNLLNLFFLTEEIKKETGVADASVRPGEVARVGVLGAGVMGGGIAQLAADKGLPARMRDIQPAALAHGFNAAAAIWREAVKKRRLTPREMGRKMDLLSGTLDYSGFQRCEVTIEAVVEKLAVKRAVLREWEEKVPATAIFASNTSTLPITEIAVGASEPGRVVGMHFFNPVHRMPLVEVIRGQRTSDATVATVFALAKTLGKTPVVVKDAPGFLVNRILAPYLSEAVRLVLEGCRIEDVDATMTRFGMPVGPLALLDDVGLDVAAKGGEVLQAAFPERLKMGGEEALAAAGRLGRKNGKGFYDYQGTKRGGPSREAYAALRVERRDKSPLPAEVIEARLVLPMINEAAFCLEDEIVTESAKLDLAMIFGTGFPPFRGGLLRHADAIGLDRVFTRLDDLAERLGPRFAPADLIQGLANARRGFYPDSPTSSREISA
jgi:3-hydroxyacyl-CoA dehydrogenase / enoyl-CoA hydratase / 3-hydroxybutyryl-CoA epimerase